MLSEKYCRSIMFYSVLAVLAVGMVVALVGIVPFFIQQKRHETEALFFVLRSRTATVEQYLTRARDISLQVTSRTIIREYLESYNRQEISLKQLVDFTEPKLKDAMALSKDIAGISRFNQADRLVVRVGLPIPEEYWPGPKTGAKALFQGPVMIKNVPYLTVGAPIINRDGVRVGTDLILFNASDLQQVITDYNGLGETGETVFAIADDAQNRFVFPARRYIGGAGGIIQPDTQLGAAIVLSSKGKTGIIYPAGTGRDLVAYGPVSGNGFGIAVAMDKGEFSAPTLRAVGRLAGITITLVVIGGVAVVLALRPLVSELRLSEYRLRHFFDNAPTYCYMVSPDGVIMDINKAALQVLGYAREEIVGKPFLTIYPPEYLGEKQNRSERWNRTGGLADEEMVIIGKSGERRVVLLNIDSVRDASGRILYSIFVQTDITEWKMTKKELATVNNIMATIIASFDLKEILEKLLDEALSITGLEGGTICMVTPENTLHLAAHRGTSEATIFDLANNEIKIGECLCGECARDHKPLILPNREAVLEFATREATRGEDIRFHAAFPLIMGDRCLGVLCVFSRTDMKPFARSLEILETISAPIALLVHNAQLHEEVVRYSAMLEDRVEKRTAELAGKNRRLEEMNKLFVDREFRIKELRDRVALLEKQALRQETQLAMHVEQ